MFTIQLNICQNPPLLIKDCFKRVGVWLVGPHSTSPFHLISIFISVQSNLIILKILCLINLTQISPFKINLEIMFYCHLTTITMSLIFFIYLNFIFLIQKNVIGRKPFIVLILLASRIKNIIFFLILINTSRLSCNHAYKPFTFWHKEKEKKRTEKNRKPHTF